MSDITYEKLRMRVSEDLNTRIKEFGKTVEEIDRHFRYLGLGLAVWHPEAVYGMNLGGLDSESYIGYSRIEGRWGLIIRTIERDHATGAFVNQRIHPIGASGNMELVVNALKKIPELIQMIDRSVEQQISTLRQAGGEFEELRNPDHNF